METRGQLATADIWLDEPMQCVDIVQAVQLLLDLDYTVVAAGKHFFVPHGITAFWILSESHCAIHTYPEHGYFSIDLYTCTDKLEPQQTLHKLVDLLPASKSVIKQRARGVN